MKKTHHFSELETTAICRNTGCQRRIKTRLVEQKQPQNITKCYRCYKAARNLGLSKTAALR